MSAPVVRRTDCVLCSGPRLEPALSLRPSAVADHYLRPGEGDGPQPSFPLDLALCRDCGHLQLLDAVDPELLFGRYTFRSASSLGLVEHFRQGASRLLGLMGPKPGALVVDIGSNDGSQLRFFKDAGLKVLGVDPAREIAAAATQSGVETWPEYFTSALGRRIRSERGPAACVLANNVFAHAAGLADMAEGIRLLLAPDGVFSFEVSYLGEIIERMLFDTVYHEHVSYHAAAPLRTFFARHGLDLFDVEHIRTKGGSIRGLVQLRGGPRPETPAVGELLRREEGLRLGDPATYRAFGERIAQAKARLLEEVDALAAAGKRLAGYGASVTVTTLMHHFELGPRLDFLVDDNPLKQGTLSPGYRLSVLPPQALYERRPDCVVVLAWQYAAPIIAKHPGYVSAGGRFILPLGEPPQAA